jgi:hypothetical protein
VSNLGAEALVALIQTIILSAVVLTLSAGLMWLILLILAPRIDSPHLSPALKSLERLFCTGVGNCQYIFKLKDLLYGTVDEITRRLPSRRRSRRIDQQ